MGDSNDVLFNEYSLDFFAFLGILFQRLFSGASGGGGGQSGEELALAIVNWLSNAWSIFTVFSWFLSILFIFGLIYAYIRHGQLGLVEAEGILHQERLYQELYGQKEGNQRWRDVEMHITGDNPNDWRLAIIEADVMLEEILNKAGYAGTTIGDKLKSASPTSFTTVNQAWRAHSVRNQVAHGGADFVLTKKVAQETVAQYKMVFQEFNAI